MNCSILPCLSDPVVIFFFFTFSRKKRSEKFLSSEIRVFFFQFLLVLYESNRIEIVWRKFVVYVSLKRFEPKTVTWIFEFFIYFFFFLLNDKQRAICSDHTFSSFQSVCVCVLRLIRLMRLTLELMSLMSRCPLPFRVEKGWNQQSANILGNGLHDTCYGRRKKKMGQS